MPAFMESRVELLELTEHHNARAEIEGDVVNAEDEDVVVAPQADQKSEERRRALEGEDALAFFLDLDRDLDRDRDRDLLLSDILFDR